MLMEKRSEKLQSILDAAKSLFWKYGIRRVTIEEICETAGVSKMTFYKYFSNKTAIARYILEELTNSGIKKYKEILQSGISYDQKVKKMIEEKLNNSHDISQELFLDLYKYKDQEISKFIEKVKNRMFGIYLDDFREAQSKGDIRPDIKPEFILFFLNKITEFMTDSELVSMYPDPQHLIGEVTNIFFYGILAVKSKPQQ
jgi:AcrR family transcriptional regulator